MIVVTGGAGFIGSAIVWRLNGLGRNDILIVDLLGTENHPNLTGLSYRDFLTKDKFASVFERGGFGGGIEVIFHLDACSDTTNTDWEYLAENNTGYTRRLAVASLAQGDESQRSSRFARILNMSSS